MGAPSRREIVSVYTAGLFQGLSLVAFPAAAPILTGHSGYGLSTSRYGFLFVPQVLLAIGGSISLPRLAARFGLKPLLLVGLSSDLVAMTLLAVSNTFQRSGAAYPVLLAATGLLGLGFGVTLSSISTYAGSFFPDRRDIALNVLNVLLGLGTALSPLLVAIFVNLAKWWYLPLLAAAGLFVLTLASVTEELAVGASDGRGAPRRIPRLFWLFAAAVLLYGIGETMFGNWGTTLLRDHGVSPASANYALSTFWAAVTVGRLAIAIASERVRSTRIYVTLSPAIAASLLIVSFASGGTAGILTFALGGLACSGFFPMSVGYGESTFPHLVEVAAGWLVAAYQIGYGLAAFGGGALQKSISLAVVFRVVAVLMLAMGAVAAPIARRQVLRATTA